MNDKDDSHLEHIKKYVILTFWVRIVVLNATFNNISFISWRSVLLVKETGVPGENHRPATSHWQTLSHNVIARTPRHERDSNSHIWLVIGTYCKSNYHMLTTTTVPTFL